MNNLRLGRIDQYFLFLLLVTICLNISFSANAEEIVVLCEPYPPYHYEVNHKPVGIVIEHLSQLGIKAGFNITYHFVSTETKWEMIEAQQAQAVLGAVDQQSKEFYADFFYFPNEVIYSESTVIFARDNFSREINTLQDLRNQTIGVLENTIYGAELDEYSSVYRDFSEDLETLIRKFANNRIQLFVANENQGIKALQSIGMESYKIMPFKVKEELFFLQIVKEQAGAEELLQRINTTILAEQE